MSSPVTIAISSEQSGLTLAAVLRTILHGQSWNEVRRIIQTRRVTIGGKLCLDPARRVKEGDLVELLPKPLPVPRHDEHVLIRHLDEHLVVVEKQSGLNSVRHPSERDWSAERKALSPALEEIVPTLLRRSEGRFRKGPLSRLRVVHRLDKDTSGLIVFARTVAAERGLGKQFHRHTVNRRYLAIVPGLVTSQRLSSRLVRDRGDGRRGSTDNPTLGKEAVTHVEVVEHLPGYTLLSCRLETGRTHQIRIHLAELGHAVCGEDVYNRMPSGEAIRDDSGAPRLALHAKELGFRHPVTGEELHWEMPLPADLEAFVQRLRMGERSMTIEIKWTDSDPETGQRRFLCATKFAGEWSFKWKLQRRGEWTRGLVPTRAMWEHVLDSLQRRYRRREGVDDDDVEQVERLLRDWKGPPGVEEATL
jgi:23S rRNA pseudouridine1911/1915/1917 synthase